MAQTNFEKMQEQYNRMNAFNGNVSTPFGVFGPQFKLEGQALDQFNKAKADLGAQIQQEQDLRKMPGAQEFLSAVNKDGSLLDQYKLGEIEKLKGYDEVKMDPRALDTIRERALSTGPSAWEQMMNNKQGMEQQNLLDKSSKAASTQSAQGINQLMARGGAGGGSMERLAAGAAKDAMFNRNAINRQGMSDRMGIGLAGQQERSDLLKALPGFEGQAADLKMRNNAFDADNQKFNISNAMDRNKFNIANALKGTEMQNNFNQNKYQEQMKAWAANRQADATERSAK